MAKKGRPFGSGLFYADPVDHARHIAFLKSRSQALYRQEGWHLTIEEYFSLWPNDLWANRGRQADSYCMVRVDPEKPWSMDNCVIITRYQQLCRGKNPRSRPNQGFPKL